MKALKQVKLLILTHRFYPDIGGTETNAEFLAGAMHEKGFDVTVITWTAAKGDKQFPYKVIRQPGIFTLLQQHKHAGIIFENHICLRLSWPSVFNKKVTVICLNTWIKKTTGIFREKMRHWWLQRAKVVIAVSEAVRLKEWPAAVVIENAYNDDIFKRNACVKKTKAFVFAGRLVSDKGAGILPEALLLLKNSAGVASADYGLTIVGDGPERQGLQEKVRENGLCDLVEFSGVLTGESLSRVFNEHAYIIVPSIWEEPYGIVALEGMACGCIPIVSDGGGLPEAVGNAGLIFKRNNAKDLADKMKLVRQDRSLRNSLLAAAPIKLMLNTTKTVAEKYYKVLKAVASYAE